MSRRSSIWGACALVAVLAASAPVFADDAPKKEGEPEPFWSGLPLMREQAEAAGADLPLPFGVAIVPTGLRNREIEVTDLRIGLNGSSESVSQFVDLGSTSNVVNVNLKLDAWILPFWNVYLLLGYVHNDSTTHALVTVAAPGPIPGTVQRQTEIETELDGFIGGIGTTLAGGYKNFFAVLDVNYDQIDMGFDDDFHALIASGRVGWMGEINELPMQLWLGAGYWNTAATAKGHADIDGVGRLTFEADQRPVKFWMYDFGGQFNFSKRFQMFIDVGTDFHGGYIFAAGPTWRF